MKNFRKSAIVLLAVLTFVWSNQNAFAQNNRNTTSGMEEFTGSIISYNGPRVATAFFNLRLNGRTSDEQARQYLNVLRQDGQSRALDAIDDNDLGSFSVGNNLGRRLNVVRESTVDGRRRIFIVFERWTQFAEHRFGTRSLDYPFGVIELYIDPRTGKGEGTYIAAARIRFDDDARNNQQTIEIENFATYPARLTNVTLSRGGRS
ncbi:MAG: hypothetical protein M3209_03185 [Acidobacteriota bacterium]|nr:hypothetical protein [Acidobacteriota bacterium]